MTSGWRYFGIAEPGSVGTAAGKRRAPARGAGHREPPSLIPSPSGPGCEECQARETTVKEGFHGHPVRDSTHARCTAPRSRLSGVNETAEPRELWGAETRKAVENFPVSGEPIPMPVARWLGRIKAAAARADGALGR